MIGTGLPSPHAKTVKDTAPQIPHGDCLPDVVPYIATQCTDQAIEFTDRALVCTDQAVQCIDLALQCADQAIQCIDLAL